MDIPKTAGPKLCAVCGKSNDNYVSTGGVQCYADLTRLLDSYYCNEHNPQIRHSILELKKMYHEVMDRK